MNGNETERHRNAHIQILSINIIIDDNNDHHYYDHTTPRTDVSEVTQSE